MYLRDLTVATTSPNRERRPYRNGEDPRPKGSERQVPCIRVRTHTVSLHLERHLSCREGFLRPFGGRSRNTCTRAGVQCAKLEFASDSIVVLLASTRETRISSVASRQRPAAHVVHGMTPHGLLRIPARRAKPARPRPDCTTVPHLHPRSVPFRLASLLGMRGAHASFVDVHVETTHQ